MEDDALLGQLLCNMILMNRIGTPQLATSEIDACQMLQSQRFDLCVVDLTVRGKDCHRAVAAANAKSIPILLLTERENVAELQSRPVRGRIVQKPASEEDIQLALLDLLPTG
ncbi:hypothetical protein [Phaeobacter sp. B1627]|uniref:hypothetical protein n=1 Tax=Phaeobacter sp. B1627 TaxID=2583809 RepID=UPI002105F8CB|nr:hypothetical protein [Phaeobacter sp. B1627]